MSELPFKCSLGWLTSFSPSFLFNKITVCPLKFSYQCFGHFFSDAQTKTKSRYNNTVYKCRLSQMQSHVTLCPKGQQERGCGSGAGPELHSRWDSHPDARPNSGPHHQRVWPGEPNALRPTAATGRFRTSQTEVSRNVPILHMPD